MSSDMSQTIEIDNFWKSIYGKEKPTQLQRYEKKNAPDSIKKFIAIDGGTKMGTTLEVIFATLKLYSRRRSVPNFGTGGYRNGVFFYHL